MHFNGIEIESLKGRSLRKDKIMDYSIEFSLHRVSKAIAEKPFYRAVVERSDTQTIDFVFNEPPPPGMYTLVVSCRNGRRESLSPAIARVKNFKVL